MQKRKLGNSNLEVSAPGLGCMEMRLNHGPAGEKQATISLLRSVVKHGVTLENKRLSGCLNRLAHTILLLVGLIALIAPVGRPAYAQTGNVRGTATEWLSYGGDKASSKYSPLDQISRDNFNGKQFIAVPPGGRQSACGTDRVVSALSRIFSPSGKDENTQ